MPATPAAAKDFTRVATRVVVCAGCHGGTQPWPELKLRDGYALKRMLKKALQTAALPVVVQSTRCLGCCDAGQACAVALDAPGKDTVVVGNLTPGNGVELVLAFVRLHTAHRNGRVFGRHLPAGAMRHYLLRLPGFKRKI